MIRHAIAVDKTTDIEQLIACKVWENESGVTSLKFTVEQLEKDHPNMRFDGWVYDLKNSEDVQDLRLRFLSPSVDWVRVWIDDGKSISKQRIYRADVV